MNTKQIFLSAVAIAVICGGTFAAMSKDDWPGCCDATKFFSYARKANSWSEYQKMIVRYTKESIRKESGNPLGSFSDKDLQGILDCIYTQALDQLKSQCQSLSTYLSYEGGTTDVYQKDLTLQKSCALETAKSVVAGPTHLQSCLTKLGLKK